MSECPMGITNFFRWLNRQTYAEMGRAVVRKVGPDPIIRDNLIDKSEFAEAFVAFDAGEHDEAFRIFTELAEAGDAEAQNNVGVLCEVSYRDNGAEEWYRRAATQGLALAQHNLAAILAADLMLELEIVSTDDTDRKLVEGYMWEKLAADQGHEDAVRGVTRLSKHMTPVQISDAEQLVKEWEPKPEPRN